VRNWKRSGAGKKRQEGNEPMKSDKLKKKREGGKKRSDSGGSQKRSGGRKNKMPKHDWQRSESEPAARTMVAYKANSSANI
jgi:hypothetical protein